MQTIIERLSGVYSATITPCNDDLSLNEVVLREMIDWQIDKGIMGHYVCGSTGEGLLMSTEERKRVAEVAIDQVAGRVPVIVHVGAVSSREAADLAAHASDIGADAVAAIPPIFYHVGFEGIREHYEIIASASDVPLIIYTIPAMAGVTLTADDVLNLRDMIPAIQGIKFTSSDLFMLNEIVQRTDGDFVVLNGSDQIFLAGLSMGAHGGIGTTYNYHPSEYAAIYNSFRLGDFGKARAVQDRVNRTTKGLINYGGLAAAKKAMSWLGFECGRTRPPISQLSEENTVAFKAILEREEAI